MPPDGIASAASALRYWERRQEVAANNLANANTDGFKAERVFARLLDDELPTADAVTDRSTGTFRPTGQSFDLAVGGDQFLVVKTPQGERWSRGGSWQLDTDGYLTDGDGNVAMGKKGPIRPGRDDQGRPVDVTSFTVDRTGVVSVNGVAIDTLRIERSTAPGSLQHEAGTRFVPGDVQPVPDDARDVRQGVLEESNVNTVSSLVDLISIQRNYAFAQKVLTTLDGIRATISNDIGKPS